PPRDSPLPSPPRRPPDPASPTKAPCSSLPASFSSMYVESEQNSLGNPCDSLTSKNSLELHPVYPWASRLIDLRWRKLQWTRQGRARLRLQRRGRGILLLLQALLFQARSLLLGSQARGFRRSAPTLFLDQPVALLGGFALPSFVLGAQGFEAIHLKFIVPHQHRSDHLIKVQRHLWR